MTFKHAKMTAAANGNCDQTCHPLKRPNCADAKEPQQVHLAMLLDNMAPSNHIMCSFFVSLFACLHALNCSFPHHQTLLHSLLKSKLEDCKRTIQCNPRIMATKLITS